MLFHHTGNGCVQHVWFAQNGTLIVRLTRDMHKCAIIARIIYALEKTIYRLKKTIYSLERLFTAQKRLFTAWSYFCRIVNLFLITWHTFNQSMNKNIWMLYIIAYTSRWIRIEDYYYHPLTKVRRDWLNRSSYQRERNREMFIAYPSPSSLSLSHYLVLFPYFIKFPSQIFEGVNNMTSFHYSLFPTSHYFDVSSVGLSFSHFL